MSAYTYWYSVRNLGFIGHIVSPLFPFAPIPQRKVKNPGLELLTSASHHRAHCHPPIPSP